MAPLVPHPSVVCTVLDEGGVLLHLDTKFYYSLNRTGMAVWTALESGVADPAALAAAAGHGASAPGRAADVRAFLAELEKESLVEPGIVVPGNGGAFAGTEPGTPAAAGAEAPRLVRHDIPLNQILSNPFDPSVPLAE